MKKIKILTVRFKNELRPDEIELFRGAVLSKLKNVSSVLFHNHIGNNFRYSYPLIQYKRLGRQAAIVCLEQGTEAIGQFFSAGDFNFRLGNRMVEMQVDSVKARQIVVQLWDNMFVYKLLRWLPFNEENYQIYQNLESIVEKYTFLEKKLIGNMLSFAKGIDLFLEKPIVCKILEVDEPYWVFYKGVYMMAFTVRFKSNLSLPDGVGLGKGVSLGNGSICVSFGKND